MAELLAPGVYIEEVASSLQVVQSVSTSTLGIIGFTDRGPVDEATLVTSYESFERIFGGQLSESFLPVSMAAYYANGGLRAYVVRVVPSDATASAAKIQSQTTQQQIETGDGVTVAYTKSAALSTLKDNGGVTPLVPSSVSIAWRGIGVPVLAGAEIVGAGLATIQTRPGTANVVLVNTTAEYEGRIRPGSIPAVATGHNVIVPGTTVLTWKPDGTAAELTLAIPGTTAIATATNGAGSVATVDHKTGRISVKFAGTEIPGSVNPITVGSQLRAAFTPATTTFTITDDGLGALTGAALTAPGTITYADGAYSFTTTAPATPHNVAPLLATYKINDFSLSTHKGAWSAEKLRVDIKGNPDTFDAATASFDTFNVRIFLKNSSSGLFDLLETFEDLIFDDPASKQYFATILNASSDWVTVAVPGGEEPPLQLQGIARSFVIAGGDEATGSRTITSTTTSTNAVLPNFTIGKRTVTISFTGTDNAAYTILDDGNGNLTGAIDGSYVATAVVGAETLAANTMSYTTGAFNFRTSIAIKAGTLVSVVYASVAAETTHQELYGDPTKGYTAGINGTFTPATYGRNQFSNAATLSPLYRGLFALNRIDELMQIVIPDFAGDTTITGDILDYVDGRASLPAGGDRFAILTTPMGSDATESVDWLKFTLSRQSKFAAVYVPWINVPDPLSVGQELLMPPMAHVAGIFARTDQNRNVAKAPAGVTDGALRFISSLETNFDIVSQGLLNSNNINAMIRVPQGSMVVFGARTIAAESEWRYVNVRRLFMFVEKSVYNSTFWICFEANGPGTWTRIKTQLDQFLVGLFNAGMLKGTSAAQAFKVVVDATNNPPETQELGQVIVDVRMAANKPIEFVRFRIAQLSGTA